MSLITDRVAKKLIVPLHVSWSFGGVQFAPIDQSQQFDFSYSVDWNATVPDLQTSIRESLIQIHTESSKVLSICISGSDSEIIARETATIGVPFELYFLDLWGNNAIERNSCEEVAKSLGKSLQVITLTKKHAWDVVIPESFAKLGAAKPTYLCLPYLLQNIPSNTFIIGGEGDPEKNGVEYVFSSTQLPIATTEVFYRQWALENDRLCDMNFYASTPELILAYVKHPLLFRKLNVMSTVFVKKVGWKDLIFKGKTNNWLNVPGSNKEVREHVATLTTKHIGMQQIKNLEIA